MKLPPLLVVPACFLSLAFPAQGMLMTFERVTSNAATDFSGFISLEVTDLGAGMTRLDFSLPASAEGFIRNVYFEMDDSPLMNVEFDPVASSADVMFESPSSPPNPPGASGFVSSKSFKASDSQSNIRNSPDNEIGSWTGTYVGPYSELENALTHGEVRVAVHVQSLGSDGGKSDTFVTTVSVPEPSLPVLMVLGLGVLATRRRRAA